ncbi:MAG: hypothetical protein Q7U31_00060, partial [Anaerolineaceae bacterium]|nr:hypothetical protein [Anaerolineaceae bacterium]
DPTSTPIPGWIKLESDEIEIWLPDSYVGGSLEDDLEVIVERLKSLGSDFEATVNYIEQNPSAFVLIAYDTKIGPQNTRSNLNVVTEKVLSVVSLDNILDGVISQFPPQFTIAERSLVTINGYQAGRMVIDADLPPIAIKELLYVIKDGSNIWGLTFTSGAEEFDRLLETFEQSVLTFKIK